MQINRALVILGNLNMPGQRHLKWLYHYKKTSTFITRQKINFILHDFLEILRKVLWACLETHTQSDTIVLQKIFGYLQAKIQLHPPCFFGNIAKICKFISGTLSIPGYTHLKLLYQTVDDFNGYLHAKYKLHHSLLP